jgi:hypothetical protein
MKIGDRLRSRIDETIPLYDKLLLDLSKFSVASQWVEQEVETALAQERQQGTTILFPVRIDKTVDGPGDGLAGADPEHPEHRRFAALETA